MLTVQQHQEGLKKIKAGLATKVRILIPAEACPVCVAIEGVYEFENTPELPPDGCSCIGGCKATYAPVLDMFGP